MRKNKRLEITLTDDEWNLLETLCRRFNNTKSNVVKQALKVFASNRKHYLTISYKAIQDDDYTPGIKAHNEDIKKQEPSKDDPSTWDKLFAMLDGNKV